MSERSEVWVVTTTDSDMVTTVIECRPEEHEGGTVYVARYVNRPGIYGMGDTPAEAIESAKDAMDASLLPPREP